MTIRIPYAVLVCATSADHLQELERRQRIGAVICRKCDGRGYVLHEGDRRRCRPCEGFGQALPDGAPLSYAEEDL